MTQPLFDLNATPRIETDRLILRGWRADDFEPFAEMMADPEVAQFLTMDQAPAEPPLSWHAMAVFVGHWAMRGYGLYVVEEKATGAFVGRVGAWRPEGWVGFELGWALSRQHWGKNYAYESARAAGDWIFDAFPLEHLVSLIHVDNLRSQRLAQRLGMSAVTETMHAGMPHAIWAIAREDWVRTRRAAA